MRASWQRSIRAALTIVGVSPLLSACYVECRPPTSLAHGSVNQIDIIRYDGFFMATDDFLRALAGAEAELDEQVTALSRVYGLIEPGTRVAADAAVVRELAVVVRADFAEHVDGAATLLPTPAACQGNIAVANEAQASCEASMGCEVSSSLKQRSSLCLGTCEGVCAGACTGPLACERPAVGEACAGVCEGACELSAPTPCDGVCRGSCEGRCLQHDAQGGCAGVCEGDCEGVCELSGAAACEGACHGACLVDGGDDGCAESERCRGSCDGLCIGSCRGGLKARSQSEQECEAAQACRGQSSIRAAMALECRHPQLELQFAYRAELVDNAPARAAFSTRVNELERRGAALLQRAAQLGALTRGTIDGARVYERAPLAELQRSLDEFAVQEPISSVPRGALSRFNPAFEEASALLRDTSERVAALDAALVEFEQLVVDLDGS